MRTLALWLSYILVFLIPWENAVTVASVGTLTRAFGFVVAGAWLLSVLATRKLRKPHPFHVAALLFVLWNVASALWSFELELTVTQIKTYAQLAVLAWIFWDLYTTPSALEAALGAYILGAYVSIGSTIFNYLSGGGFFSPYEARYTGASLNACDLALILALGLPVAWHLATSAGQGWRGHIRKLVNYAYIPLALFAMLLTGSRMALFAIVPAFLFILATSTRLNVPTRAVVFLALVVSLFALQPYIPQTVIDRLATTGSSIAVLDLGGRVQLWGEAVEVFSEYPVLGVGSGALPAAIRSGSVAHNSFLSVPSEVGIVGFALFVGMIATVVYAVVNQPRTHRWLWLAILAVWAVGVSTLTWEYRKPTWLLLSLAAVSASLYGQRATSVADLEASLDVEVSPSQRNGSKQRRTSQDRCMTPTLWRRSESESRWVAPQDNRYGKQGAQG